MLLIMVMMYVQRRHGWTYQKRPGVEYFLSHLFDFYEIVIFTSDIPMVGSTYCIPVCMYIQWNLSNLDTNGGTVSGVLSLSHFLSSFAFLDSIFFNSQDLSLSIALCRQPNH